MTFVTVLIVSILIQIVHVSCHLTVQNVDLDGSGSVSLAELKPLIDWYVVKGDARFYGIPWTEDRERQLKQILMDRFNSFPKKTSAGDVSPNDVHEIIGLIRNEAEEKIFAKVARLDYEFRQADLNADGYISPNELRFHIENEIGQLTIDVHGVGRAERRVLKMMAVNKARHMFEQFDLDGDNRWTADDYDRAQNDIWTMLAKEVNALLHIVEEYDKYDYIDLEDGDSNGNGLLDVSELSDRINRYIHSSSIYYQINLSTNDKQNINSRLNSEFNQFDPDRDGQITAQEASKILLKIQSEIDGMYLRNLNGDTFPLVDTNRDGKISLEELTVYTRQNLGRAYSLYPADRGQQEDTLTASETDYLFKTINSRLARIFAIIDTDNNSFWDQREFAMGEAIARQSARDITESMDRNGHYGRI